MESIKSCGSPDGYNTVSPEWIHIDFAKEAYHVSNKHNYLMQMTKWLAHQESVAHFNMYLDWVHKQKDPPDNDLDNSDDGEVEVLLSHCDNMVMP